MNKNSSLSEIFSRITNQNNKEVKTEIALEEENIAEEIIKNKRLKISDYPSHHHCSKQQKILGIEDANCPELEQRPARFNFSEVRPLTNIKKTEEGFFELEQIPKEYYFNNRVLKDTSSGPMVFVKNESDFKAKQPQIIYKELEPKTFTDNIVPNTGIREEIKVEKDISVIMKNDAMEEALSRVVNDAKNVESINISTDLENEYISNNISENEEFILSIKDKFNKIINDINDLNNTFNNTEGTSKILNKLCVVTKDNMKLVQKDIEDNFKQFRSYALEEVFKNNIMEDCYNKRAELFNSTYEEPYAYVGIDLQERDLETKQNISDAIQQEASLRISHIRELEKIDKLNKINPKNTINEMLKDNHDLLTQKTKAAQINNLRKSDFKPSISIDIELENKIKETCYKLIPQIMETVIRDIVTN